MNTVTPVRPSPIAGSWYPSDPAVLASEIQAYIDQADPPTVTGEVLGLIAPHAGYFYSGATAGHAYRSVSAKSFDHCVIFSPLHDYLPYDLITSAHSAYGTPLGQIMVDHELITAISEKIQKRTGLSLQHIANDREHSLEIQLPFLQQVLVSPFTLVPIMVRTHDSGLLKNTAQAIAEGLEGLKVLLVASTDLSHFYSEKDANDLDAQMLKQMTNFSPEGVLKTEGCGEGYACGAGAVALMLWTAEFMGATKATLLHYSTSAAASGDSTRVVGYGALAITR